MAASTARSEPLKIRRADGVESAVRLRARETTIGGMTFYIGIAWPADKVVP